MNNPYPIPRQLRESDPFVGDGGAVYADFDFKIFDIADVEVWAKAAGEDGYSKQTVTVAKLANLPFDNFSVTFSAGQPNTTSIVVRSARIAERTAGVVKGTRVDNTALEKELSKQASVLEEVRRDLGRAVMSDFGEEGLTVDADIPDGSSIKKVGDRLVAGPDVAAGDAALAAAIAAETAARIAADLLEAQIRAATDTIETLARQAGDAALQSLIGKAGFIQSQLYDSRLAISLANVDPLVNVLIAMGYTNPGDTGLMVYVRAGAEPPHQGKVRSANGAWFLLVSSMPTVQMFNGDAVALRAYLNMGYSWLSADFVALALRGDVGTAALQSLQGSELRTAAGMGDNRIYLGSAARSYPLDPENFYPAVHMADPGANVDIKVDVTAMRIGETYAFANNGLIGNGFNGGTITVDCGAGNHFRGDIGVIPNITTTTVFKLYPGQTVFLFKTGGNRITVSRQIAQNYWSTGILGDGSSWRLRRTIDGTLDGQYFRKSPISANSESLCSFLAGVSLDGASVTGCEPGPKAAGTPPPNARPSVPKKGTLNGLSAEQFTIFNADANAFDWPITCSFTGITVSDSPVPIDRPVGALVAGQSYGENGYNYRAAYPAFAQSLQNAFKTDAASILTNSGITVTALSLLQLYNKAVGGSAILQAHASSAGYWVTNDYAPGPLLTSATTSIAGYPLKPHFIVYSHGEQDATALISDATADQMQTALTTVLWPQLRTAINAASPDSVPIFVDMLGPRYPADEQREYKVRDHFINAIEAATNVYYGAEKYALELANDEHPVDTNIGYRQMGAHTSRIARSWLIDHDNVLRAPSILSATRVGNRITVTIDVPAGKTLVKPAVPDFLGVFDADENRLGMSNFFWAGNTINFDVTGTPAKFRYPCPTGKLMVDTSKIIRLSNPSDPLYAGEIGLPLRSCKTIAL